MTPFLCHILITYRASSGELSCPYQRTDNAYPRYLDTVINDVKNEVDCEVKCTFYENFVCRSFAYYSSARQCFVSGDDTGEGGREFLICLKGILFAVSLRFIRNTYCTLLNR